jgi:tetratricopeptide (TPR) repeat protein
LAIPAILAIFALNHPITRFNYNLGILRNTASLALVLLFLATLAAPPGSLGQQAENRPSQMVLIMPFENNSTTPGIDWIGEAFPEVVGNRINAPPLFVISRSDRLLAFDRLGLPPAAKPSRATVYQVAQELDVDYVLMGDYRYEDATLTVHARLMELSRLQLSAEMSESGPLTGLINLQTALAWDVLNEMKLINGVSKQQFVAQLPPVRLDALENYIRGVLATTNQEKIKHFAEAVRLEPTHTLAMLQLGKTYYDNKDYTPAINWLAKIPLSDSNANEAQFYLGLAAFYSGQMERAAEAFRRLASRLPLTEVYNNLGVVSARLGDHRALDYFQKSVDTDPSDPDYHFNLAVEFQRQGQHQDAARELKAALAAHPDTEAKNFLDAVTAGGLPAAKLPLQRIKRNFDESSFRQLALEIENTNEVRVGRTDTANHVAYHIQRGRELLELGLPAEAEKQFRAAIVLDPNQAGAHAGMARVLETDQDKAGARKEAQAAVRLAPTAEAYLVLARLDLAENNSAAAAQNVDRALALDPANAAAVALKHDIAAGLTGGSKPPRP